MPLIDDPPKELLDAIQEEKCVLFVGAGLSVAAGYPTWISLLDHLIARCLAGKNIDKAHADELKGLIKQPDKLLMVAQDLSDRFTPPTFRDELAEVFSPDKASPTDAHIEITKTPFACIVTTNYDDLLEQAYAKVNAGKIPRHFSHEDVTDFADALWKNRFFILKAHGDAQRKSSMVITERDYRTIIHRSPGYRTILSAIFATKTVLFLGVSLTDPETKLLLTHLHDAFAGSGQYHFALVSTKEFNKTVANHWRTDFKVQCLQYEPTDKHPEVLEFIKKLPKKAK